MSDLDNWEPLLNQQLCYGTKLKVPQQVKIWLI